MDTVTDQQVRLSVQLNEQGTLYALALSDGQPTPTAAEIRLGSVVYLASGHATVGDSAAPTTLLLSGLPHSTAVKVVVVAEDTMVPGNLMHSGNVAVMSVSTAEDASPPTFLVGYPAAARVTDNGFGIDVELSEPGRVLLCVALASTLIPSPAEVVAGSHPSFLASMERNVDDASAIATFDVTGLGHDTAYDVFLIAEDAHTPPNVQVSSVACCGTPWLLGSHRCPPC